MCITLTLPAPVVQLVLQSLGTQPYAQVASAIQLISAQAQQQIAQAGEPMRAPESTPAAPVVVPEALIKRARR